SGLRRKEDAIPGQAGASPCSSAPSSARPAIRRSSASVACFPMEIGSYLVSEPIGAGGMASVHLGVAANHGTRLLALKRLHPHLVSDAYFTTMLLDEAQIAARVRHANVVATYGADVVDGDVFVVMEYVAGVSLNVIMRTVHPGSVPARYATAIV